MTGCDHAWTYVGYLRGARPPEALDCQKPLRAVCDRCSAVDIRRCRNHREDRCKPCARRYRRQVREVAYSGVIAKRSTPGFLYMLTLTSPSDLGVHCLSSRCHLIDSDCPHPKCPCSPAGGVDLRVWNVAAARCWNRLRTVLRRQHPGLEFFRAVEVQEGQHRVDGVGRGALHLHVMVWSPTPLPGVRALRSVVMQAGFGHSVQLAECLPGSRKAAYYVSKYVSKACGQRAEVPWHRTRPRRPPRRSVHLGPQAERSALAAVQHLVAEVVSSPAAWAHWQADDQCFVQVDAAGEVVNAWSPVEVRTLATHRNWSMSRGYGLRMAQVRAAAAAYAAARATEAREVSSAGGTERDCEAQPSGAVTAPP